MRDLHNVRRDGPAGGAAPPVPPGEAGDGGSPPPLTTAAPRIRVGAEDEGIPVPARDSSRGFTSCLQPPAPPARRTTQSARSATLPALGRRPHITAVHLPPPAHKATTPRDGPAAALRLTRRRRASPGEARRGPWC